MSDNKEIYHFEPVEFEVVSEPVEEAITEVETPSKYQDYYLVIVSMMMSLINGAFGIVWYRALVGKMLILLAITGFILGVLYLKRYIKISKFVYFFLSMLLILMPLYALKVKEQTQEKLMVIYFETMYKKDTPMKVIGYTEDGEKISVDHFDYHVSNPKALKYDNGYLTVLDDSIASVLTLTDDFGKKYSLDVEVYSVEPTNFTLHVPQTLQFFTTENIYPVVFPEGADSSEVTISLKKGSEEIVEIDPQGTIMALKPGVATIIATHPKLGVKEFPIEVKPLESIVSLTSTAQFVAYASFDEFGNSVYTVPKGTTLTLNADLYPDPGNDNLVFRWIKEGKEIERWTANARSYQVEVTEDLKVTVEVGGVTSEPVYLKVSGGDE